jgi:hypothetical protein
MAFDNKRRQVAGTQATQGQQLPFTTPNVGGVAATNTTQTPAGPAPPQPGGGRGFFSGGGAGTVPQQPKETPPNQLRPSDPSQTTTQTVTPTSPMFQPQEQQQQQGQTPEDIWAEIMEDYNQGLPEQYRQADIAAGTQARRASEMASQMAGGGAGGAFQSGQAQAGLYGQQLRMDAARKHQQRGLEMKMAWLEMAIKRAEAQNNRELAEKLESMRQDTAVQLAEAGYDPGLFDEAGGGGGGGQWGPLTTDWWTGENSAYGKTVGKLTSALGL